MRVIVAEDNFLRELLAEHLPEHGIEVTGHEAAGALDLAVEVPGSRGIPHTASQTR